MEKQKAKLFYGWKIVIASFMIMFLTYSILTSLSSIFIKPVTAELGFSRGQFQMFNMIMTLCAIAASPFVGVILKSGKMKYIVAGGTVLAGLCHLGLAYAQTLMHWYAAGAILGLLAPGLSIMPISILMTNWFQHRRGTALGIAFAGSGGGGFVLSPLLGWVIQNHGWRMAYTVEGLLILCLAVPIILLVYKRDPADIGEKPLTDPGLPVQARPSALEGVSYKRAKKTRAFYYSCAHLFFLALGSAIAVFAVQPYLVDIGYSYTEAAMIMACYLGVIVFGKIALGYIYDKIGSAKATTISCLMLGASYLALFGATNMFWIVIFVLLNILGSSVGTIAPSYILADLFGKKDYSKIYGVTAVPYKVGALVGIPLTGFMHDHFKNYDLTWIIASVICGLAVVMALLALRARPEPDPLEEGVSA